MMQGIANLVMEVKFKVDRSRNALFSVGLGVSWNWILGSLEV